jgi:hypothetical protein
LPLARAGSQRWQEDCCPRKGLKVGAVTVRLQLRVVRSAFLACALILGMATTASAASPEKKAAKGASSAVPDELSFTVHVVTSRRKPVAGATVRAWAFAGPAGGFSLPGKRFPPTRTDDNGNVRIIFPLKGDDPEIGNLRDAAKQGISLIGLRVDHPAHALWKDYVAVEGDRRIMLSDATTIEVRAHREQHPALVRRLYPVLSGPLFDTPNWSERDGVLTIRRVDTTGDHLSRWLRIVHVPDHGPPLYSDLIDLRLRAENPIRLDVVMKAGARVLGRLAEEVPRPVKNGRVVARIVHGARARESWKWEATAPIQADGSFVLESLPAEEHLQLIALCDDWVSPSPSLAEVNAYSKENNFPELQYVGPNSRFVYPRLYRLKGPLVHVAVPMRRTASCEVAVDDDAGKPIPGASVEFWPNQIFFNTGAQMLGTGFDSLKLIQSQTPTTQAPTADMRRFWSAYSAKTNTRGLATVRNLPLGSLSADPTEPISVNFHVFCSGYFPEPGTLNPPPHEVGLLPGGTAHVTVDLRRNGLKQ